jgi:hypothetical protein
LQLTLLTRLAPILAHADRKRGEQQMRVKSRVAVACCVAVVGAVGAGAAFAGESTGNGRYINGSDEAPLNGKSACAYSGQNPEGLLDPSDPNYEPGRAQSWGQIPKAVRDTFGFNPGVACNPTKAQPEE